MLHLARCTTCQRYHKKSLFPNVRKKAEHCGLLYIYDTIENQQFYLKDRAQVVCIYVRCRHHVIRNIIKKKEHVLKSNENKFNNLYNITI